MQGKKITDYLLLSVPLDMLEEAGIREESVIQMSAAGGKILIEAVSHDDMEDFVCDCDCENCPLNTTDCDGDCESCLCAEYCGESEENKV